jgi:hypothetical protein
MEKRAAALVLIGERLGLQGKPVILVVHAREGARGGHPTVPGTDAEAPDKTDAAVESAHDCVRGAARGGGPCACRVREGHRRAVLQAGVDQPTGCCHVDIGPARQEHRSMHGNFQFPGGQGFVWLQIFLQNDTVANFVVI